MVRADPNIIAETNVMRPSQGFYGGKGHLFQGNGSKGQFLREKGEQRQYWGNREHEKKNDFWGTGEQANLFLRNKGTGTNPGRASVMSSNTIISEWS